MKTIDIDEASLQEYARKRRRETWVLTRRGKPIAAVVPLQDEMDAETFAVSHSPALIEIVNRSWSDYEEEGRGFERRSSAPSRRRQARAHGGAARTLIA